MTNPLERTTTMTLHRVNDGKIIAGVATGLSRALGIDVTIVRILFAVVSVFLGGGVLLYAILWAVMPRESGGTVAEEGIGRARTWYADRKQSQSSKDYDI